jgi:hypothetical protein
MVQVKTRQIHYFVLSHFRFIHATRTAESKPLIKLNRSSRELTTVEEDQATAFTELGRAAAAPRLDSVPTKNFLHVF